MTSIPKKPRWRGIDGSNSEPDSLELDLPPFYRERDEDDEDELQESQEQPMSK